MERGLLQAVAFFVAEADDPPRRLGNDSEVRNSAEVEDILMVAEVYSAKVVT
jgi:hypothetical protein